MVNTFNLREISGKIIGHEKEQVRMKKSGIHQKSIQNIKLTN